MSIVISAKNEEKNLDLLVDSLLNQKYPKSCYEIIIANDKSTDSTLNKLNEFKKKYNQLIIVDIQNTPKNWLKLPKNSPKSAKSPRRLDFS